MTSKEGKLNHDYQNNVHIQLLICYKCKMPQKTSYKRDENKEINLINDMKTFIADYLKLL